jgi:UDP-2-acetamido-2,6-beta-L-arabino-hexul-4-ose reductase
MKLKIGITGKNGFLGYHLSSTIKYNHQKLKLIDFKREYFNSPSKLDKFTSQCDIIVHLAGVNRAKNQTEIKELNVGLAKKIRDSLERTSFKGKLIFSSSTQERNNSIYGSSKKKAREIFEYSANKNSYTFIGLLIPNIFGPFCRPNYNSFISTFCNDIINNKSPKIIDDNEINLVYVSSVVKQILNLFYSSKSQTLILKHDKTLSVSSTLDKLINFNSTYVVKGNIPAFNSSFDLNLFNTFRSYIVLDNYFPRTLIKNSDERGFFSEIIRTESRGQFSYSSTKPKVTRGNHFHTRKIERFTVIQGEAIIEIRKIGDEKIYSFSLNGDQPSYVDMPVWYTHNIKNISNSPLITLFWINEPFEVKDPDTFYEIV